MHPKIHIQIIILILLILISAFFSSAETGMMAANRYKLRHVSKKSRSAQRVLELLKRPDRLLGIILIGNTLASVLAATVTTMIAVHFFGDVGVAVASLLLALIILIFGEVTPKTFAAVHPERIASLFSLPLYWLLKMLYPLVWIANCISNNILRLFKIKVQSHNVAALSHEELRSVVYESASKISARHRSMLLSILDLEKLTVDDIMIPRSEIVGIDINKDAEFLLTQLTNFQHTRIIIYTDTIDNVCGIIHIRKALKLIAKHTIDKKTLLDACSPPYFIPEHTPLNLQLLHFQKQKHRIGLVVDEYGDILGLVTLEDILEEIVGEFTTNYPTKCKHVTEQKDGSYFIDGSTSIRELNKTFGWHFSTKGPKTLNGLIVEHLEMIPEKGICVRIQGYPIEIMEVEENTVSVAKILPNLSRKN